MLILKIIYAAFWVWLWLGPNYNIVKDYSIIKIEWDPKREKGNEK